MSRDPVFRLLRTLASSHKMRKAHNSISHLTTLRIKTITGVGICHSSSDTMWVSRSRLRRHGSAQDHVPILIPTPQEAADDS